MLYFSLRFLLIALLQCHHSESHSIGIFLQPLRKLQIVIHLPVEYYSPALEVPLGLSLNYLHNSNAAVQIFSKSNRSVHAPAIAARRFEDSRVTWIVFVQPPPRSVVIRLMKILKRCEFWSLGPDTVFSLADQHLINLIAVNSVKSRLYGPDIPRHSAPFYLMIFNWKSPDVMPSRTIVAYDVCFDLPTKAVTCKVRAVTAYFDLAQQGIDSVVKHLRKLKMNFVGDKISVIYSSFQREWEWWKGTIKVQRRQLQSLKDRKTANIGVVLGTLCKIHNLTFDTVRKVPSGWRSMRNFGFVHVAMSPGVRHRMPVCRLSFNMHSFKTTLMTADVALAAPHELSDLALPLTLKASLVLLGLTICMSGLLHLASAEALGAMDSSFIVSVAFLSSVPLSQARSISHLRLWTVWLFFTTFIAILYTSLLQSYAVAPGTYFSELSFQEMIEENFEFLASSDLAKDIQRTGSIANLSLFLENGSESFKKQRKMEILLGEKVRDIGSQPFKASFLVRLNRKNRRVLVGPIERMLVYADFIKSLGLNAVVGKDVFWEKYFYWMFMVDKGILLRETLEAMKASGLVYEFSHRAHYRYMRSAKRFPSGHDDSAFEEAKDGRKKARDSKDAISMEAIFLFMYGVVLSLAIEMLELLIEID